MSVVTLLLGVMLLVAGSLFIYVGHEVKKKRKAMQFISMQDRNRYMNLTVIATTILVAGVVGFLTTSVGGGSMKKIAIPFHITAAKEASIAQVVTTATSADGHVAEGMHLYN